jgi:4-hydroxy-tetrahydrodipicolinate reductase
MKIKLAISGATGRVGSAVLVQLGYSSEYKNKFDVVSLMDQKDDEKDHIVSDPQVGLANAQVLIDFTRPEATLRYLPVAMGRKVAMVIGTTGFTPGQVDQIRTASKHIPILLSSNMSLGMNYLFSLVEKLARRADPSQWDVEIVETHHNKKEDSPSGSAMTLLESVAKGWNKSPEELVQYGRPPGKSPRLPGKVGVHSLRAGNVVGEHTVLFAGGGETLEFTHRAFDRRLFATGALFAAEKLAGMKPGFYSMRDLLKID